MCARNKKKSHHFLHARRQPSLPRVALREIYEEKFRICTTKVALLFAFIPLPFHVALITTLPSGIIITASAVINENIEYGSLNFRMEFTRWRGKDTVVRN